MGANLVTLQEYKIHSGINSTNQDAELNQLIPQVSELVKSYCRRSFIDYYDEAKTEFFDGGFKKLLLKETPVVQIISVSASDNYGQTYTKLTKFTDWVQKDDQVVSLSPQGFPEKVNGYKVDYFAGYEAVPQDLKIAILDLMYYYMRSDSAVHSTKSISPNTMQVEYITNTNLPAHIKRILDLYMADYS